MSLCSQILSYCLCLTTSSLVAQASSVSFVAWTCPAVRERAGPARHPDTVDTSGETARSDVPKASVRRAAQFGLRSTGKASDLVWFCAVLQGIELGDCNPSRSFHVLCRPPPPMKPICAGNDTERVWVHSSLCNYQAQLGKHGGLEATRHQEISNTTDGEWYGMYRRPFISMFLVQAS